MKFVRRLWMLTFLLALATPARSASPFDPLSSEEHWRVLEVLHDAGVVNNATRYSRLSILPPDKKKAWSNSGRGPRLAEIVVKQGEAAFLGVVNVSAARLVSWEKQEGVQPPWLMEEYIGAIVPKVKADPRFQAALEKRGFDRPEFVQCRTSPPGSFGEERFEGKRIGVVRCFPTGPETNKYPRRVEGLLIFADMNSGEILEIDDYEVVPAVDTAADYHPAAVDEGRKFAAPMTIKQEDGPGFSIDGNLVSWDRWKFHIQSDQRVGIVISEASFGASDKNRRPILYQGYLSEISVPYMAPYGDWYLRNPIDAGEYSAGGLSDPLVPGVHCPAHAEYIDGLIVSDRGAPKVKEKVICIFERISGDPLWVHDVDGRQNRTLVARMSARLGNYDYLTDWEFSPDGQIRIVLGATGIVAIKNTVERFASSKPLDSAELPDSYGRFVDDHVVAINHSHYFSFRLDLDVDGVANDFRKGDLVLKSMPEDHPRKSIWVLDERVLQTEDEGRLGGGHHQSYLRIASASKKNRMGYPTSYHLMPGGNAAVLMGEGDYPRLRAGFVDHPLWITAYHPEERFAAGDFPTLSKPGQGLPAWSQSENIAGADLVAWYTVGMHHVVRAEDWPVMPVLWHDVTLRPFDFFDRNAAMSLEPTKE